jgi:cellulose synthase/poly-beta-1,6-N-acetylglucosamine synthase-like glycosyltransferase
MAVQILVLLALYVLGHRHVRGGDGPEAKPGSFPRVAVIVPLTGDTPDMRRALASLVDQDYPDYALLCVTESEDDPAVALVRDCAVGSDRVGLVTAGPATACGQKNHNILAGVRTAATAEVFAFCDSTHQARRDFVSNLVAPIARGDASMTSGFHKIMPEDSRTGTIGMGITCLALHLLQPIRAITQPWGGAMAISRQAFERFDLYGLWSKNIVDDFSMGPHLHRWGLPAWPVASACLDTPLSGMTLARWDVWLTRQLLYLKFCIPPGWLVSILAVFVLSAPPVLAVLALVGWLAGGVGPSLAAAAILYLVAFGALGLLYRRLSPRPVPVWAWLRGYAATFFMLAWCFGRTFTTNTMSWRGIDYKVGWGGVVREVIRRR